MSWLIGGFVEILVRIEREVGMAGQQWTVAREAGRDDGLLLLVSHICRCRDSEEDHVDEQRRHATHDCDVAAAGRSGIDARLSGRPQQ